MNGDPLIPADDDELPGEPVADPPVPPRPREEIVVRDLFTWCESNPPGR
ncbi:hypothetical protein MF672_033470 [Actinomadura sp. ATCC 31491]|uniref:Uncharacterized protein n=1 Tax=Actinomadura luzonensis TaxID=2805427 RepID=A0ABT0G3A7_9ACTN|nr:hypothetical protein [Actinomadura luzonensis]MCK2218670.1 hypothetical protein [Actinomadura luzonensis]